MLFIIHTSDEVAGLDIIKALESAKISCTIVSKTSSDETAATGSGLLGELETAGNKVEATIYNICHRNAGWAIQWHDRIRQGESDYLKDGLFIDRYYPTLPEAMQGELARVQKEFQENE